MPRDTLIIGHRGASRDAPENTLASFRLAFRQGADGIEADFRLTRDGHVVCLHDPETARTGDADLSVRESTLSQLARLDVGLWKGAHWAGEAIPTLSRVLAELPPGKRIFIELKSGTEIVIPLAADLSAAALPPDSVRLLCFDQAVIRALKERLPGYRACWLVDYRWRGGWQPSPAEVISGLERCGADGLASRDRGILDRALVQSLRERGLEIHVWTVDSAPAARRLRRLGVDSIMTNRPGWIRGAFAAEAGSGVTS